MELEEIRNKANHPRGEYLYGVSNDRDFYKNADDDIDLLLSEIKAETDISKNWHNRYDNLTSIIHKAVQTDKNQERDYPENELKRITNRITELEAQRDELLEAADRMIDIVESTEFQNDDDAPSNDEMNRWHNAIFDVQ